MSQDAFEEVYNRIIDAELGLRAIREILRGASQADAPLEVEMRNNAIEWIAGRMAEQMESISNYAEEQARGGRVGRRA